MMTSDQAHTRSSRNLLKKLSIIWHSGLSFHSLEKTLLVVLPALLSHSSNFLCHGLGKNKVSWKQFTSSCPQAQKVFTFGLLCFLADTWHQVGYLWNVGWEKRWFHSHLLSELKENTTNDQYNVHFTPLKICFSSVCFDKFTDTGGIILNIQLQLRIILAS